MKKFLDQDFSGAALAEFRREVSNCQCFEYQFSINCLESHDMLVSITWRVRELWRMKISLFCFIFVFVCKLNRLSECFFALRLFFFLIRGK